MNRLLYKRYGVGAVFVILAFAFIVFGVKNAGKTQENEPYYTTVSAVITEKYTSPIEDMESFADVTYTDLSGIERSGRIEYSGSANVGDTIEIEMSTHNPTVISFANPVAAERQNAEISKNKRYAVIEIAVGAFLFVTGIFLIVRRIRQTQAPDETVVPQTQTAKSADAPKTHEAAPKYDINKMLDEIDKKIPPKPMVKLTPKRAENLSVFESKLGGVPYMPADFKYPKGKSGIFEDRPLRLLAQLNFEKLPHIENFPEKGILQFFCSDDEEDGVYGLNFDNRTEQNGFRVIYHENIIADESRLMPKEKLPAFTDGGYGFPFKGEFLLKASAAEMCPVSAEDHHFEKILLEVLNKISGKEYKKIYELGGKEEEICEKIYEIRACEQTCIGGYPFFTQDDPRGYTKKLADYDVLLFQCNSSCEDNSEDEIMWGDMGVANFFITEEDLKNRDFSKAAYNWDCG